MSFEGKTALVTGAVSGLGRAIAEKFLDDGANVVVCDVNDQLIADFNEKVASRYEDRVLVLRTDVTSEAALDELFAATAKKFGHADIVVNNAAIIDRFDPMGTMDMETWSRVLAINLTAPAFVIKRAVNMFLEKNVKGSIVNVASIAAFRGFTCGAAYTASKHGVLGLTRNTAAFYGSKGIRCNAIMPGSMATNIGNALAQGVNMEGMQRMRVNFPETGGMELCDVNQVASLVAYLCSPQASVLNGSIIAADNGATAN